MNRQQLINAIHQRKSCLCIGLDTDLAKIPPHLLGFEDPVFEFNKAIIDATKDFCVAYKPNIAFYECLGSKGWESLAKTLSYIPDSHFTIADAKRGDIGNTAMMYAKTFFETFDFDSVTVAPYMGRDSVQPFLDFNNKWTILLALTSNQGAADFEELETRDGKKLFQKVLETASKWGNKDNLMFVVGANHPAALKEIRQLLPESFFLVPGVGAQGGSLKQVMDSAIPCEIGLLINASRSILYASGGEDFAEKASFEASIIQQEMAMYITS